MHRRHHPTGLTIAVLLAMMTAIPPLAAQQKGLADRILAQPAQAKPANCDSGNRIDLELCAVARFRSADAELNRVYRELAGDTQNRDLLLGAQRVWLAYRDATCAWEQDRLRGGTAATLYAINCLAAVTEARTSYLVQASGP
ncbi:lysozyme inhibitor LprI family protein [Phreatobacter stygius]|uniref:DUF1311 domain-containing protein n=1 Tax=Phreatobacter stygius TaxID=1940610 RepID=A0A4D7B8P4_9HYPH|nr:lysozyme inhibitor LprI family protein [Phreatobacter stygius]QCI64417.1 DUF1311 domain-containing protein [Phreatobacter stygius]